MHGLFSGAVTERPSEPPSLPQDDSAAVSATRTAREAADAGKHFALIVAISIQAPLSVQRLDLSPGLRLDAHRFSASPRDLRDLHDAEKLAARDDFIDEPSIE